MMRHTKSDQPYVCTVFNCAEEGAEKKTLYVYLYSRTYVYLNSHTKYVYCYPPTPLCLHCFPTQKYHSQQLWTIESSVVSTCTKLYYQYRGCNVRTPYTIGVGCNVRTPYTIGVVMYSSQVTLMCFVWHMAPVTTLTATFYLVLWV